MARAILDRRSHRANGEVALHVLAVMTGILESAEQQTKLHVLASCERPAPLSAKEAQHLLTLAA
jgi:hypothetical protein